MAQDKINSGTPHSSTDDLIADYLSDMFGSEPVPASDTLKTELQNYPDASLVDEESSASQLECKADLSNTVSTPTKTTQVLDVFGGSHVSTMAPIASDMSLIPTIKLIKEVDDKSVRSQSEAQIILLTFLFYLRKPLSPRVRQTFLDYSEQAIDDYYAAFWLKEAAREESLQ